MLCRDSQCGDAVACCTYCFERVKAATHVAASISMVHALDEAAEEGVGVVVFDAAVVAGLAAAVVVDAIGRLLPGVLNDETSALFDSFQDGMLAPPVYTRPANFRGWEVPEQLLCGDPKKIDDWRHEQSLIRTAERRPGLLEE